MFFDARERFNQKRPNEYVRGLLAQYGDRGKPMQFTRTSRFDAQDAAAFRQRELEEMRYAKERAESLEAQLAQSRVPVGAGTSSGSWRRRRARRRDGTGLKTGRAWAFRGSRWPMPSSSRPTDGAWASSQYTGDGAAPIPPVAVRGPHPPPA